MNAFMEQRAAMQSRLASYYRDLQEMHTRELHIHFYLSCSYSLMIFLEVLLIWRLLPREMLGRFVLIIALVLVLVYFCAPASLPALPGFTSASSVRSNAELPRAPSVSSSHSSAPLCAYPTAGPKPLHAATARNTSRRNIAGHLKDFSSKIKRIISMHSSASTSSSRAPQRPNSSTASEAAHGTGRKMSALHMNNKVKRAWHKRMKNLVSFKKHKDTSSPIDVSGGYTSTTSYADKIMTIACGICLEDYCEDELTRIDGCGHSFCMDCLRMHVLSKIQSHSYPVFCPTCTARQDGNSYGAVDHEMVLNIGLSESEYASYVELELMALSVQVTCSKCRATFLADRDDYRQTKTMTCPSAACGHRWCKDCSQVLDPSAADPSHSCDGSLEMDHLMLMRGWKRCPDCETAVEKTSGCNHITCTSPGCNTHFCYACGARIIRSVKASDIHKALSSHYKRCPLQ